MLCFRKLGFITCFVLCSVLAHCQISRGVESITRAEAEARMAILAGDAMQGREAGTSGARRAAEYIFDVLSDMGYRPYYQYFEGKKGESMQNVLVLISGRDTATYSVIGAHYDHLGVKDGDIFNGADDNASGVVAVLEIASAIKAAGEVPARNIILALWDGEESGLQGSKYFVTNSIRDSSAVKNYMNFDMIGRNNDESDPMRFNYFYTKGHDEFRTYLDAAIRDYDLGLKPIYGEMDDPRSGSDNVPFSRRAIPFCWYHTNGHVDFHKPTDTVDKINWDKMVRIIKSAYVVAWMMSQR